MSGVAVDPVLACIVRAALALLFGWSAAMKLRDVDRFRAAVDGYQLLPSLWVVPAGAALIAAESGVAAALCLPGVGALGGLGAASLLLLYAGAIAINLARGRRDIDCGCGGPAGAQPIGPALVIRNVLLAAAALIAAMPSQARVLTWVDGLTIGAAVATLACLYAAAGGLLRLPGRGTGTIGAEASHA